ncbi:MAG: hypothetical protein C4297_02485 [Gemmataceae bacterium]
MSADSKPTVAVAGVVPPEIAEAVIAVRWPSVVRFRAVAGLGARLQQLATALVRWIIRVSERLPTLLAILVGGILLGCLFPVACLLAFAAWLLLAPFYFSKIAPFTMTRYVVTNRRVMIQRGWSLVPVAEIPLERIASVRVVPGSGDPFYLAADIEIYAQDAPETPALVLQGVKEYEQFRVIIENTYLAWGRKNPPKEQIHPATELAKIQVQRS